MLKGNYYFSMYDVLLPRHGVTWKEDNSVHQWDLFFNYSKGGSLEYIIKV